MMKQMLTLTMIMIRDEVVAPFVASTTLDKDNKKGGLNMPATTPSL